MTKCWCHDRQASMELRDSTGVSDSAAGQVMGYKTLEMLGDSLVKIGTTLLMTNV